MSHKILIIGAGPSGASCAIFLAVKGFEVTLIERKPKKNTDLIIGESLPPNAQQLLLELDIWEEFQSAGHLKYYGNKSIWGSSNIAYTDFISHPIGNGWHIDRGLFEMMLIRKAEKSGVEFLEETAVIDVAYDDEKWKTKLKTKDKDVHQNEYDFIIDASGRNSWLARKLGVDRLYESQQLALVAFLKTNKTPEEETSLIETAKEGWWYSAKIPNGKMATAFLCKPEKSKRDWWVKKTQWWTLLNEAPHTAQRIQDSDAILLDSPRFVSADSSILEKPFGTAWLAIGDAAMAYDPIASHGILMGMVSARDASKAIQQHFDGNEKSLEAYSALLWAAFQYYAQRRKQFYQTEKRFGNSVYWNSFLVTDKK